MIRTIVETVVVLMLFVLYFFFHARWNRDETAAGICEPRMIRIQQASHMFQFLIFIGLVFDGYWFLAFLFGWPSPIHDKLRVVISPHHIFESARDFSASILSLWIVKSCLGFCGWAMLLRLFWLYGRGILFSARNVTCIRFLGYWLILNWVVDYQLQALMQDMALSMTPVFIGLLVIFVAWVMDEGRKIQEEQELTV